MEAAAEAVGRRERMRPTDLSLAIAVNLVEVHQGRVLCWPNLVPGVSAMQNH